jgi:Spy/CpxP family protein refolding chaperone
MNKNTFVKRVVVGGGLLLLCAAPKLTLGQSSPPGSALRRPIKSIPAQRRTYISPTEYLAGLTLTDDQIAKITQIRDDTRSHLAAVAKDEKLAPDVKDAMVTGYQRIENSQIFEVLTPEQQGEVRKRIATLRAAAEQPAVPGRNPQSK